MKGITVLGSTGSIGMSTLDVIGRNQDRYRVVALTACKEVTRLFEQCQTYQPKYAVMVDQQAALELQQRLRAVGSSVEVLAGSQALETVASLAEVGIVMAAIVGAAGLLSSLAAAKAGKRILLANKEALVMSGELFMQAAIQHGAELLPVDSEHNAIFQCLPHTAGSLADKGINKIWLTASGGPFRTWSMAELATVTPEQAVAHPTWDMGAKVSIDSANLMNKGLEVIEAHWLFGASAEEIDIIIHPQSAVHSLVEYRDGAILAELGNPDMRTPIANALAWPERISAGVNTWETLLKGGQLQFEPLHKDRYPCVKLAYEALRAGGTAPALLNAANEVAVTAFRERRLRFIDIPNVVESVLAGVVSRPAASLPAILAADQEARVAAVEAIQQLA